MRSKGGQGRKKRERERENNVQTWGLRLWAAMRAVTREVAAYLGERRIDKGKGE